MAVLAPPLLLWRRVSRRLPPGDAGAGEPASSAVCRLLELRPKKAIMPEDGRPSAAMQRVEKWRQRVSVWGKSSNMRTARCTRG